MAHKERLRRSGVAALVGCALLAGVAFSAVRAPSPEGNHTFVPEVGQQRRALEALETLQVKGRAPRTGYSRDQFGGGWQQLGNCDMRNHILRRDLSDARVLSDTDCTVLSGTLFKDPYTGRTIRFKRGSGTSSAVQIDHIVAVSDAWQKGGQLLSATERTAFYNDPLNLLAVDGPANGKKGDSDAATWLPPNRPYRCRYVARQIAVKVTYRLWVTRAEQNAMLRVLRTCPGQVLPIVASPNQHPAE
jgi:uncharacterized protein DUF1524